jgi:hypothetical protein
VNRNNDSPNESRNNKPWKPSNESSECPSQIQEDISINVENKMNVKVSEIVSEI